MNPEREWAKDLTQNEFAIELCKRNPLITGIPAVERWINETEKLVEKYEPIKHEENEAEQKVKPVEIKPLVCEGCGKEYASKARYANMAQHKHRCKKLLEIRL